MQNVRDWRVAPILILLRANPDNFASFLIILVRFTSRLLPFENNYDLKTLFEQHLTQLAIIW